MATLTLQLGQFGNQVGLEFLDQYAVRGSPGLGQDSLFRQTSDDASVARACLIDMEPKVVYSTIGEAKARNHFSYLRSQTFVQQGGSSNNWAHGYRHNGPRAREAILDCIRREAEHADSLRSFTLFLSLAGGTGSGVGAYVSEALRDVYPKTETNHVTVWPYAAGEVTVQCYNSVLTLGALYGTSDGIVSIENDRLETCCRRRLGLASPALADVNVLVAEDLAHSLLPAAAVSPASPAAACGASNRQRHPLSILSDLAVAPAFRMLSLYRVPVSSPKAAAYAADRWPALFDRLRRVVLSDAIVEDSAPRDMSGSSIDALRLVSLYAVARGSKPVNTATDVDPVLAGPDCLPPSSIAAVPRVTVAHDAQPFAPYVHSVSAIGNGQGCMHPIRVAHAMAKTKLRHRAYLHHYTRHGVEEEELQAALLHCEQVLADYGALSLEADIS